MPVKVDRDTRDGAGDPRSSLAFLSHPGEMGALMRSHAWKESPLGDAADWPDVLKAFVNMILASSQPMFMAWGDSLTWFYNDAFIPILGRKHGDALGRSGRYVWAESWSTLQAMFARVFAGESLYLEDLKLELPRRGRLEEAHFAFSYTPVKDATGQVAGLFGTCVETTEQVLASRRAREADERLQLALSAGDGVGTWDWSIPNDIVVADERFARWYGVDPEYAAAGAPLGTFLSSIHPEDRDAVHACIAESMRVGGDYFIEYRLTRPNGSLRWVSAQGKCTLGADGKPLRFLGVTFDITSRKKAEIELRNLNQDLERQIAEQTRDRSRTWEVSPEIMGILNREGYFEKSNPAWGAILGWSEQEIRNTPFFDFIHPDDVERTEAAWADTAQGKPALRFENRYRRKEGGWCWLSWVAVPEGDKVYCTARHITADKARSEELQSATVERERLWQSSPDLLIVLDFDGTILRVNPAWTEILGYETDHLVGRHIADFAAPVDLAVTREAFRRAANQPLPVLENRFLHQDGSQRWLSWVSSTAGNHIYAIGRHITAAKEAAAALTRAEDALRQSQKMEAVGQLTGGIAHDFNNLLAGISGSLELIHLRIAQNRLGELNRYIDAAQSASRRASSLTQRLLAFARRQTLDSRPVDVNKLIAGMEELLRRSVGPMVELQVLAAAGLWTCKLDAAQLENAVLNLCINARDAMAPNGGKLTLETSNKTLDEREAAELGLSRGLYVCMCVADTGCGMPPEVIAQVFDPFFTTKPMGQGTGLGLSMVYGFMRQSGGQVRVISEVGKGSTLYLYVPRHVGQTVADEHTPALAVDPGAGETVLIIDDEATIRMVASEILRESGYEVLEAEDGPSGLKILESETAIDLLVTDVGLPGGMNGRQVADAARLLRPDLKVLFITGYAESAIVGNGLLEDGMSIITKPFEMAMFANKVRELIDTSQRD